MQATDPSGPALQGRGLIRFAVFEVDLRSGEVRKNGLKVRLTGQPFQVLAMLLKRPGEVVAREDLQKRLWPSDTFVDFDHSLNTAINKIREALGDSAESPRFVETLPRRGCRFIAPVEAIGLAGGGLSALAAQGPLQGLAGGAGQTAEPASRKRWPLAVGVALGLLAAAVLGWYVWQRSRPRPELTQRQLTTNSSELAVWASAMSPDGRYLAYADDSGIHLKVLNTSETHDLSGPPDSKINKLAWFPESDGLLASVEAGQPRAPSLWSISVLGGAPRKLRDDASDGEVLHDGTGIVFVVGGGTEIWQMGPEGETPLKLLTASPGELLGMPVVIGSRLWYGTSHAAAFLGTMGGTANNWNRLEGYEMESRNINGGPPTILVPDLRAGHFYRTGVSFTPELTGVTLSMAGVSGRLVLISIPVRREPSPERSLTGLLTGFRI
jgi:DNA-binding winged helix-turn-helix (wHTH) protein